MTSFLFFLLSLLPLATASGYFDLTLRSPWRHDAAIGVYQVSVPLPAVRSLTLAPNVENTLRFPVDFNQTVKIVITVGLSANFGLENSRYETVLTPQLGSTLAPETVPVPFDGFKVTFGCAKNFHGEKCQQQCNEEVAEKYGKRCNSAGFTACPVGFMGQNCTDKILMNECPCQNLGTCSNSFVSATEESFHCDCPQGFYGKMCETRREVQTVEIRSSFTPELRYVSRIIEKHYNEMAMKNKLDRKRVKIQLGATRRGRV